MKAKAIGWVRDKKGKVVHYTFRDYCNCLTTFCGGSGYRNKETGMDVTTPYAMVIIETE